MSRQRNQRERVWLTASEYARHRGCTRQVVHQAILTGKLDAALTKNATGRRYIDMELADRLWYSDPDALIRATMRRMASGPGPTIEEVDEWLRIEGRHRR